MQANAQPAAAKGGGAPQSEDQDQPALIKMTNQCLLNHDMPVRLPQKAAAQKSPAAPPRAEHDQRAPCSCPPDLAACTKRASAVIPSCTASLVTCAASPAGLSCTPNLCPVRCQLSRPVPCAASPYTCTKKPSRPADRPILHPKLPLLPCQAGLSCGQPDLYCQSDTHSEPNLRKC